MDNQVLGNEAALRTLHLYKSILGLTVLEMPAGKPWFKLSFVYILIKTGIFAYCFYNANIHTYHYSVTEISIKKAIVVISYSNIAIAIITTILGFVNYEKMKRFESRIALIDETLLEFGIDPEYSLTNRKTLYAITGWIFGSCFLMCLDMISHQELNYIQRIMKFICLSLPLILNLTIELNFAVVISVLGKKFERLNCLLQRTTTAHDRTKLNARTISKNANFFLKPHFPNVDTLINHDGKKPDIEKILKIVRQIHLDLCRISRKVNRTCSLQISLQMMATFITITGFSYFIYVIHTSHSSTFNCLKMLTLYVWIGYSVFRIIFIVYVSYSVSAEVQRTSQIAYEIDVPRWKKNITIEIHQLSLQLMQHPLYFTAGSIAIDFNYVRGFVGAVTTYLMILIQSYTHSQVYLSNSVNASTANISQTQI